MKTKLFAAISASLMLMAGCTPQKATFSEELFMTPPHESKPRTWMHVMSGNMSKEGLTKDLQAMSDAGLGGVLMFNIAQGTPYGNVKFNSDEHQEMIRHAAAECERLGLSFGFHNCDGWTSSGGPWITPEQSMKMLTYTQTVVDGGNVSVELAQPTSREDFYKDIAVLAYPALATDVVDAQAKFTVTSSDPKFDVASATDFRTDKIVDLKVNAKKEPASVTFDYGKPFPLRSIYISTSFRDPKVELYVSDNGRDFTLVQELDHVRVGKNEWNIQNTFAPLNKRYYKFVTKVNMGIKDIQLSASEPITDYLSKNCMARTANNRIKAAATPTEGMIIDKESIVNVTADFKDGKLTTSLPDGQWTIMRVGYTSTSAFNHPASDSGRGLECDKFNRDILKLHFDAFCQRVIDNCKDVAPNALQYIEIDSYEMGGQNWTEGIAEIFEQEKGYDIVSVLPVLLGKYVDDPQTSDAVLTDFRSLCCNLMTENYFGAFADECHENGLKYYLEPYGFGPIDDLTAGGKADIPMGEFWMNRPVTMIHSAVSSAHIYGKSVISAESFTSRPEINWMGHPDMAKSSGDAAWKEGINEFMFHRFAHQANTHVAPGMTMNRWGFHFDRTQTWWLNAGKAWFNYIARGSYMLRQGTCVSDVLVFVGDASPMGASKGNYGGLQSDAVNTEVLMERISVKNGKMQLPEGSEYQCLVLTNTKQLTIETLRRICELAEAGVAIEGELPESLLGYVNLNKENAEFTELIERIKACKNYYPAGSFAQLVSDQGLELDFQVHNWDGPEMRYSHRKVGDQDAYFLSNTDSVRRVVECDFRIEGKVPELWKALDGSITKATNYKMENGRTKVNIELEGLESVFIVFRETTDVKEYVAEIATAEVATVEANDNWSVTFEKEYGYDATVDFATLEDWSLSDNDEVKYYSGTATYKKTVDVDAASLEKSNTAILDLGKVCIAAEVFINGENAGMFWNAPYKKDVYKYLKAGANTFEIKVTNQWTNRLIGDERYPAQNGGYDTIPKGSVLGYMPDWYKNNEPMPEGPRMTFCTQKFYNVDSPLISAGLVGPVQINLTNQTIR